MQSNIDRNQFVSVQVLSENEVQSYVTEYVDTIRSSSITQVTSLIHFLEITIQSNSLIPALNTIASLIGSSDTVPYIIHEEMTEYYDKNASNNSYYTFTCDYLNGIAPAGFYSLSFDEISKKHKIWPQDLSGSGFLPHASAMVNGFYGGCTPFHALLASALDCLYNISCLEQLRFYFPGLNHVCIILLLSSHNIFFDLDWRELDGSSSDLKTAIQTFKRFFE